jgi:hypothetical protein
MSFNVRRCTHYRDDNSTAKAVEINVEVWRFCLCLVLAL